MIMIKKVFSLSLFLIIYGGLMTNCSEGKSEEDGFTFMIRPMYMIVEELPTKIGERYKCSQTFDQIRESSRGVTNYEMVSTEINPTIKPKITAKMGIGYQKERRKIEISGWLFESNNSTNGHLRSQKKDQYNFCINGVSMFGRLWIPIQNDLEPSGYAPVSYWGNNKIRVAVMNTAYGYSIIKTPKWVTNILVGMKGGHFKITKEGGKQQVGWINNYFGTGTHRLTTHELASKNELKMFVVGPEVKSENMIKGKNSELKFGISHGILLGIVENDGDFWESYEVYKATNPHYSTPYFYYKKMFPVVKKERVTIPVTEAELAFNLIILKTKKVSVGCGILLFASIWKKIPIMEWNMPSEYPLGSGWTQKENGCEFYAALASIHLNF